MAVQKNFIIRNGLEVNNNLLVVDISSDRVGIGTSNPKNTLEVIGGIGVTDANILGIGTVLTEFNVGSGGTVITSLNTGLTGFGTHSPGYIVDIRSPVSSGQTALYVQGDVKITGDLYADDISFDQSTVVNLEVSGIASVATGIVTNLTTTGVTSIATGIVTNLRVSGIASIATGIVTNLRTTGIASIATGVVTTGFINTGIITTLSGSNISYTGIGSFGSVNADIGRINTGIVTNLTVSGLSTFTNGPVLIGSGTLSGRASELKLQVTGDACFIGGGTSVGIGTTTPAAVFDLRGNARFGSTTSANAYSSIFHGVNVDLGGGVLVSGLNFNVNSGNVYFRENSNNTLTLANGSVGIGTTNPTSTLSVQGDGRFTGVVTASSFYGDGSTLSNIVAGVGINTAGGNVGYGATILDFRGSGISSVTVSSGIATINITGGGTTSTGGGESYWVQTVTGIHTLSNVGVGTTNSTSRLTVSGSASISGITTSAGIDVTSGNDYKINNTSVLTSTTLGSSVVNSSLTNVGTLSSVVVSGISTFTNGPVLIGSGTSTGTSAQRLQVTGGAYVSGNLGIGSINPTEQLDVVGNGKFTGIVTASSFSGSLNASNLTGIVSTAVLASGTADSTTFLRGDQTWYSLIEGATITNDNSTDTDFYVGFSQSPSGTLSTLTVSSNNLLFNPFSGNLSATQFTSLSDATQKTNVRPIDNAIDLTKKLQGVRFDWINNNKPSIGVIAQEVEKILPEIVETNSDGIKSVCYGNIIGVLIEAIKEQQVRIEELERKLDA